jgi:flagellar biosynthesis chaperone FliJ
MARDSLKTVMQLRQIDVDGARAELMRLESLAHDARMKERAAVLAIQTEMNAAARLHADDATVEAFGAWLPTGRAAVTRARAQLGRFEQDAAQARATLNLARAGAEAVEKLMAEREKLASEHEMRRQQALLDEAAARARPRLFSSQ